MTMTTTTTCRRHVDKGVREQPLLSTTQHSTAVANNNTNGHFWGGLGECGSGNTFPNKLSKICITRVVLVVDHRATLTDKRVQKLRQGSWISISPLSTKFRQCRRSTMWVVLL